MSSIKDIERVCIHCGKRFYTKRSEIKRGFGKFCSRSCAAKVNNIGKNRHAGSKKLAACVVCDSSLVGSSAKKFCSRICQAEYYWQEKVAEIEKTNFINFPNRILRRYLLQVRNLECEICKNTTWQDKPISLEVHHKDGNSKNNDLGNLCLVCPNCHALTDSYKGKNRGNGRETRRKRYKNE